MKAGRIVSVVVAMLVVAGLVAGMAGCSAVPKGATKEVAVGAVKYQATGAGIVKADAQKVTFKIKCTVCGFESEEVTVDAPVAGKPHTMEWTCPKCGHKQKITIQVVGT